jgi:hypothetical protein
MSLREVSFGLGPVGSLIPSALATSPAGFTLAMLVAGGITLIVFVAIRLAVPQRSPSTSIDNS